MTHIDGDGPNPNIYHLIWSDGNSETEKLDLNIPETIIFLNGVPTNWYFTGLDGKVLKKKIKNLSFEKIIAKFTSGCSQEDIAAYFIHIDTTKMQQKLFIKPNIKDQLQEGSDPPQSFIEYYTTKEFTQEFSRVDYQRTGILQKFIPSKAHNDVIQTIWTPNLCVFTKKVNSNKLTDTKLKPHEKASTFDGPEFYSSSVPVKGKHIPVKLRETCEAISKHIATISYGKIVIERLVAYFKVDEYDKLYFLWAGSIRVNKKEKVPQRSRSCKDRPISLEPGVRSIEVEDSKQGQSQRASSCASRNKCCVVCNARSNNLVPIMYKILIKNAIEQNKCDSSSISLFSNQVQEDPANSSKLSALSNKSGIPAFLHKLYPKLRLKDYLSLCQQESFLIQKAQICEDCFLEATQNYEVKLKAQVDISKKVERIPRKPLLKERNEGSQTSLRSRQYRSSSNSKILSQRLSNRSTEAVLPQVDPPISSDSQVCENPSKPVSVAENLRLKLSMLLLRRKENPDFSAKTAACSISLNQNSSSTRTKITNTNDQLSFLRERCSQNLVDISARQDQPGYSSQDRSRVKPIIPYPNKKPKSLNSSRAYQSRSKIQDIDDLLNDSNENVTLVEQKPDDDQSEATTNYQSSVRERCSRNGSWLLDTRDIPGQKSLEIRRLLVKQSQLEAENQLSKNENFGICEQDQTSLIRNFFLKPEFRKKSSENLSDNFRFLQDLYPSLNKTRSDNDYSKQDYNSAKHEITSELPTDQENIQKSVVIEKLYRSRMNTSHRAKFKKAI